MAPSPISLAEAQSRLLALVEPLATEELPVEGALHRCLAAPLLARRTQPPSDLSAMDGYAVRADDLAGPWIVIGESAAGHPFTGKLAAGQAVRISTGAVLPEGAGAVLLQENTTRDGLNLALNGEGPPSPTHIRRTGFDFSEGDLLLDAGICLRPAQVALTISAGYRAVCVHTLPALAVLDNGDELSANPADCAIGQIPASNGAMLAAMAAAYVSTIARLGPVPDRLDTMVTALEQAGDADVIVTSGGASVGDHDLVRPAIEAWGGEIDFWRVAIKPGKPLMVARKGRQIVLGLPGNPVSSYVTAHLFLLPLLRKLGGAVNALPRAIDALLYGELPPGGARMEFLRARWRDGQLQPIREQDSSALRALTAADALVERPIGAPAAADGDRVRAYLLDNGGVA